MTRSNIDDVNIFLAVECSLGNPLSRFVINMLSKKNNDSSLIEDALLSYCGIKNCTLLEKLKTAPLCALLGIGRTAFGADKDSMQEYFGDPVARKGLINVIRSIGLSNFLLLSLWCGITPTPATSAASTATRAHRKHYRMSLTSMRSWM